MQRNQKRNLPPPHIHTHKFGQQRGYPPYGTQRFAEEKNNRFVMPGVEKYCDSPSGLFCLLLLSSVVVVEPSRCCPILDLLTSDQWTNVKPVSHWLNYSSGLVTKTIQYVTDGVVTFYITVYTHTYTYTHALTHTDVYIHTYIFDNMIVALWVGALRRGHQV